MEEQQTENIKVVFEEIRTSLRERRAKNLQRRREALTEGKDNTLEIQKCQSIDTDSKNYFES